MSASTPTPPTERPSKTNQQCKVCTSPDRFEIEVALARGQSQASVAARFSQNGQSFNRQNINAHYHNHMQVLDLAVAEAAAQRGLSPMLEIQQAGEIHAQNERNLARLRGQVDAAIKEGLPWKTRDVLAFMEQDVRLGDERNELLVERVMVQARTYGEAVRRVVPDDLHVPILAAYDEILARKDLEDFMYHDERADGDEEEAGEDVS